ncbi:MAG: peptidoglycan editing factor PgeF [Rhodospirillales bacterium]
MITAQNLTGQPGVRHMFFTRQGGVSSGIYTSLNCGPGSDDDRGAVLDNRARAMAVLDQEPDRLVTVHQHHSPIAVAVRDVWALADAPKADAMVTSEPGIVLGILTADCAPVLFCDADAGVIGAAHAGWKGALGGVIDATVELMVDAGAHPDRISAAVGPCIQQPSYEVGADFRSSFMEAGSGNGRFFTDGAASGKFQFDLSGYVRFRLSECRVGSIEVLPLDTYKDEDRFFSYRRTTHRGEPDYGRELSAIVLEG